MSAAAQPSISAEEQLQQARSAAQTNGDERTKLVLENAQLLSENARLWKGLAVFYGVGVACDHCGAPATKPCMTSLGRITVHDRRVTKAAAAIASDDLLTADFGNKP